MTRMECRPPDSDVWQSVEFELCVGDDLCGVPVGFVDGALPRSTSNLPPNDWHVVAERSIKSGTGRVGI